MTDGQDRLLSGPLFRRPKDRLQVAICKRIGTDANAGSARATLLGWSKGGPSTLARAIVLPASRPSAERVQRNGHSAFFRPNDARISPKCPERSVASTDNTGKKARQAEAG